jgi:hypothetical protein
MFEDKCKDLRSELKEVRDEVESLNAQLADMVPRAELLAARKVRGLSKICPLNQLGSEQTNLPPR